MLQNQLLVNDKIISHLNRTDNWKPVDKCNKKDSKTTDQIQISNISQTRPNLISNVSLLNFTSNYVCCKKIRITVEAEDFFSYIKRMLICILYKFPLFIWGSGSVSLSKWLNVFDHTKKYCEKTVFVKNE